MSLNLALLSVTQWCPVCLVSPCFLLSVNTGKIILSGIGESMCIRVQLFQQWFKYKCWKTGATCHNKHQRKLSFTSQLGSWGCPSSLHVSNTHTVFTLYGLLHLPFDRWLEFSPQQPKYSRALCPPTLFNFSPAVQRSPRQKSRFLVPGNAK